MIRLKQIVFSLCIYSLLSQSSVDFHDFHICFKLVARVNPGLVLTCDNNLGLVNSSVAL